MLSIGDEAVGAERFQTRYRFGGVAPLMMDDEPFEQCGFDAARDVPTLIGMAVERLGTDALD